MEQRTLEIELTYYRKKYQLNQEDICSGICSVAKLSRLEQGYREIDSLIGESLLGRIGKEITLFELLLNEEDYDLWKKRKAIQNYVENKNLENAEKCIREYRRVMPAGEAVHEQFCMYEEVLIMLQRQKSVEILCQKLEESIKLTIPEFKSANEKVRLYNQIEIEMILLLFRYDTFSNDIMEKELLKILTHVKKYFSQRKKEEIGIKILFELIEHANYKKYYKKVVDYAEEAINLIREGKRFRFSGYWTNR